MSFHMQGFSCVLSFKSYFIAYYVPCKRPIAERGRKRSRVSLCPIARQSRNAITVSHVSWDILGHFVTFPGMLLCGGIPVVYVE